MNAFPNPPDHFRLFKTPTALAPPPHTLLSSLEFYPMFGRPVANTSHPNNCKVEVPAIERDIVMYDLKGDFKTEARKLSDMLPKVVDDLLNSIQMNPDTCNEHLRNFDNVVKNMYHLLEVCRQYEAFDVIEAIAARKVKEKRKKLEELNASIDSAKSILSLMDQT